jgi:hypothetical protein
MRLCAMDRVCLEPNDMMSPSRYFLASRCQPIEKMEAVGLRLRLTRG